MAISHDAVILHIPHFGLALKYWLKVISECWFNSHLNLYINTLPCRDLNPGHTMDPCMKQMAYQCATVVWYMGLSLIYLVPGTIPMRIALVDLKSWFKDYLQQSFVKLKVTWIRNSIFWYLGEILYNVIVLSCALICHLADLSSVFW